ncbi:transcriptional regulator PpsR [Pontivivens ytuae]|uniref:Transcriptional regulator PpsR n=1 Tax=Pontivivens ytuae TaxID=2789856 RepID=A0A7S9LQV3_9RHOB|nr:transcriptional regulator PpsR [Pontivivens ytuae]QPH53441.1 transcriptional regulator PpsR [Pontivivens ytuae]
MTRRDIASQAPSAPHDLDASDLGAALARACDILIVIDAQAKIRQISVNAESRALGSLDHWTGRALKEFLTVESRDKLAARMQEIAAGTSDADRVLELNHEDNAAWAFPIRYVLYITRPGGLIFLMGQDLRPLAESQQQLVAAQIAMERDHEVVRQIDTRHRVLMEKVESPILFVEAPSGRVIEANGRAQTLADFDRSELIGARLDQAFGADQSGDLLAHLMEGAGPAASAPVHCRTVRGDKPVAMIPSLFRAGGDATLMIRIESGLGGAASQDLLERDLAALFDRSADGIVFTDAQGGVRGANEAFLTLCDVAQVSDLTGTTLADLLSRGSVDQKVLLDNAARRGRMRLYATRLSGAFGRQVPVEIAVTALGDGGKAGFGLIVRDASRTDKAEAKAPATPATAPMREVMDLVGTSPLKEIVSATTDVIERMCIETALELTNDNRVAAAEMLGLSRQSLYVKLRKFDLLGRQNKS